MSARSTALAALAFTATAVQAEEWYVGLGLGNTSLDLSATLAELKAEIDFDEAVATDEIAGAISGDDSGNGFKLFGGYEFKEHFAIELGYTDLDEGTTMVALTAEDDVPSLGIQAGDSVVLNEIDSVTGLSFAVLGKFPFSERLALTGKLGVYAYELDYDFTQADTTGLFGSFVESDSEGDAEPFYGVSLDVGFDNGLGVNLFYEAYGSGGDLADFVGIGLTYDFGRNVGPRP